MAVLWVAGVSCGVLVSSAVVLDAAGRIPDPVTTLRLASGDDALSSADVSPEATAPRTPRFPDIETVRGRLAAGTLSEPTPPVQPAPVGTRTLTTMRPPAQPLAPTPSATETVAAAGDRTAPSRGSVTPPQSTPGARSGNGNAKGNGNSPDRGRTLTTDAGTVRVVAEGRRIQVVYATPRNGHAVSIEGEGTAEVRVDLRSQGRRTRVSAVVVDGAPRLSVTVFQDDEPSGKKAPGRRGKP